MFSRGDLHIHSTASDGELSPTEIVLLAKKRGIDTIAIADHNSVCGINEASEAGKKYGISIIPAVELSTRFNGESIHLLGYFSDKRYKHPSLFEILKLVKIHNINQARKVAGGFRGKNTLDKYLAVQEGMYLLRKFGASVVLAHPVRISSKNLPELLAMPFDGLEAKYCFSSDYHTKFFIKIALNRFSFYTAGSDFHTNKRNDCKHCVIGDPCLTSIELQNFLTKSHALVLGTKM